MKWIQYVLSKIVIYLKLLRIKHYIKNLLVFAPLFFSINLFEKVMFIRTLYSFFYLCLLCSSIYIINDIIDRKRDQQHPIKSKRPIASGEVSIFRAFMLVFILFIVLFMIPIQQNIKEWIYPLFFIISNLIYTIYAKHIPIFDVFFLAMGYPIRVLYGGVINGIHVSNWLFMTVLCFALFLAFGKRYGEKAGIVSDKKITRPVLKQYTKEYLFQGMNLCMGMGVVFYALWARERTKNMIMSVPLLMVIVFKYSFIVYEGRDKFYGDPIDILFSNKILIFIICLFVFVVFYLLYFNDGGIAVL